MWLIGLFLVGLARGVVCTPTADGGEIGFVEDFALSTDLPPPSGNSFPARKHVRTRPLAIMTAKMATESPMSVVVVVMVMVMVMRGRLGRRVLGVRCEAK
jgi:hypothetical protein